MRLRATAGALLAVLICFTLPAGPTAAQTGSRLSLPELKKALLSDTAISRASGTGYPTVSTAVTCAPSGTFAANYCYREYLHSNAAKKAHAPWPTHVNVFSFSSTANAKRYLDVMAQRFTGTGRIAVTESSVVGVDPSALINDGLSLPKGQEASVVLAHGTRVVWAACGDLSKRVSKAELVACAKSVATAQASRLG